MPDSDAAFMRRALEQASRAGARGEVPVGAVIVCGADIVSSAHNATVAHSDPTAHAECLAIKRALDVQGSDRLTDCTLYVTLEPCAMCAGAIVLAKVRRVVYGASDLKAGMAGSIDNLLAHPRLNHRPLVTAGVLAEECAEPLTGFFRRLRETGDTKGAQRRTTSG